MNNSDIDIDEITKYMGPNEKVLYVLNEYKVNYYAWISVCIILILSISGFIYLKIKYNMSGRTPMVYLLFMIVFIIPYVIKQNESKLYITNRNIIKITKNKSSINVDKLFRKNIKELNIYLSELFNTYRLIFISNNEKNKNLSFSVHRNIEKEGNTFSYIKSIVFKVNMHKSFDIIFVFILVPLPFVFVIFIFIRILQYFNII